MPSRDEDILEVGPPILTYEGPLGRTKPADDTFKDLYPVDEAAYHAVLDSPAPRFADGTPLVPVVAGTPWLSNFDSPKPVHSRTHGTIYVVGLPEDDLGDERGGHCYDMKPPSLHDPNGYWVFYNQGDSPRCTGYGTSHALSQVRGVEYDANWLYEQAKLIDGDPDGEGSTVDAVLSVLHTQGPVKDGSNTPSQTEGIASYHWATSWEQVRTLLGVPNTTPFVPFCNSWGEQYPHVTFMHDSAGEAIFSESEFGIFVPR